MKNVKFGQDNPHSIQWFEVNQDKILNALLKGFDMAAAEYSDQAKCLDWFCVNADSHSYKLVTKAA